MDVQAARPPLISAAQPRRDVGKVLFHAAQDIGDFRAPLYGARAFFPLRAAAGDEQAADLLLLHAAHAAVPRVQRDEPRVRAETVVADEMPAIFAGLLR